MRQAQRLQRLEEHPQVRYERELQRLRKQDGINLEEIKTALNNAGETEQNVMIRALTDGQLLTLIDFYELEEGVRQDVEMAYNNPISLEAQAQRNIELKN